MPRCGPRQVAARYAPDLQLVGAAAAAPPTDLVQNLRLSPNKQVRTFFTAYIGYTWNKHYGAPLTAFGECAITGYFDAARAKQLHRTQFEAEAGHGAWRGYAAKPVEEPRPRPGPAVGSARAAE